VNPAIPATPGSAAATRSVVVADRKYSAYPTRYESGIRAALELLGASGSFACGACEGAGGASGAGRPSGCGATGGGAASGTAADVCGMARGTDRGAAVPAERADVVPRMTILRVIGAEGTDGRFDDRPTGLTRDTAPPPPRLALCGLALCRLALFGTPPAATMPAA